MFCIKQAGENTFYIDYPSRVGIYKTGPNTVCLIDSGNDSKTASRTLKLINEAGWKITAIFNTHCHADHTGGNAAIQAATGCEIYCPDIDLGAVKHTMLNQIMLCGCYPAKELDHRFYLAEKSVAKPLTNSVLPQGLEIVHLKGHTMGMVGFKTKDNVYFLADSVVSPEILQKYTVTYLVSVYDYLDTLDYLETLNGALYLPSHVPATENIKTIVSENRKYVYAVIDMILSYCKTPRSFDDIIAYYFSLSELKFSVTQHALIGSTIRSYISCLQRKGKMELICKDNRVFAKTVENK